MPTETFAFISSKMVELAPERQAIYDLLPTLDSTLINLRAWVFEKDAPASENSIRQVYLAALANSDLYIGVFWNYYGEYTIDEFEHATLWGIERHIYVKDVDTNKRDPRLTEFLNKISNVPSGITPRWFTTEEDLGQKVRESLSVWVKERLRGASPRVATLAYDLQKNIRNSSLTNQQIESDNYFYSAYQKQQIEDTEGAFIDYSESIRLNPYNWAAYHNRAILYGKLGNTVDAITDYTTCIRINPKAYLGYFNRGLLLRQNNRLQEALMDFSSAISHDSPYVDAWLNIEAYLNRAAIYEVWGYNYYSNAIFDYNSILTINPYHIAVLMMRARLYENIGGFDQAIQDYNQVLKIDPYHINANMRRTAVYQIKLGNISRLNYQQYSIGFDSSNDDDDDYTDDDDDEYSDDDYSDDDQEGIKTESIWESFKDWFGDFLRPFFQKTNR